MSKEQETKPAPVKRRRSRRKKGDAPEGPPPKDNRMYFNADTQRAIVAFQTCTDMKERERLYRTEIMPAFEKLVENLINIYKFTGLHDTFDNLKNDCVNFLFETIRKFDDSRGTNAFSYFNQVAKNWLIIKSKQRQQRTKRSVSIDDVESLSSYERGVIEEHNLIESQDIIVEKQNVSSAIIELLYEIRTQTRTENELICINSIITVFENVDQIDILNKSALLVYIKELSGLSPKQLTTSMQSIKKHYRTLKLDQRFESFF